MWKVCYMKWKLFFHDQSLQALLSGTHCQHLTCRIQRLRVVHQCMSPHVAWDTNIVLSRCRVVDNSEPRRSVLLYCKRYKCLLFCLRWLYGFLSNHLVNLNFLNTLVFALAQNHADWTGCILPWRSFKGCLARFIWRRWPFHNPWNSEIMSANSSRYCEYM